MEQQSHEPPELTPDQYAAGREIAEACELGEDILTQKMVRNGSVATVEYGLAYSAHHIEFLSLEEIRKAVFFGIAEYQAMMEQSEQDG